LDILYKSNKGKNVMLPYFRPHSSIIINALIAILNGSTWICGHSYLRLTKIIKPPISIKQIGLWKRLFYNYIFVFMALSRCIVFQYISIVIFVVAYLAKDMSIW